MMRDRTVPGFEIFREIWELVSPLLVDVPDTVEMWIVAMIDLVDHSPI